MNDDTDESTEPNDTMRRRAEENRAKLWLLLDANRWVVAAAVVVLFFLGTVAVAAVVPNRVLISVDDPVETLFQALVTATITSVTLVVSINSLVLSQELGALGDQRERMEGAMSFRRDVEEELGIDVAAATPAAFLRSLVDAVRDRADALSSVAESTDQSLGDGEEGRSDDLDIQAYADDLGNHASEVHSELEGREFGTFGVLSAALNFNYSWKIHGARRLRAAYEGASVAESGAVDDTGDEPNDETSEEPIDETSEEPIDGAAAVVDALDDLISVLTLFGPTREHIKTLYFQWELVNLSRAMLYSAIPALIVSTNVLLFHGVLRVVSGATLGIAHYVWIVALTAAVALAPFAILLSFVLRIGTIAKRTLSIGPFILRTARDADTTGE